MILLDANVFMYAAGREHPNRRACADLIIRIASGGTDVAADVEVLQEILHRFRAQKRWEEGRRVYDLARRVVLTWISIDVDALDRARGLMDTYPHLTARDALHAAVCLDLGAEAFCSFDRDFDGIEGLRRVEPDEVGRH